MKIGFINISYIDFDGDDSYNCVPWINSSNEIVAFASTFDLYPTGLADYDLTALNINSSFYNNFNNKSLIFPSANYKIIDDKIYFEVNVFHYLKTRLITGVWHNFNDSYNTSLALSYRVGGTYVNSVTIRLYTNSELSSPYVYITSSNLVAYYSYYNSTSIMETYYFYITIDEIKSLFNQMTGSVPSRLYYYTSVNYLKYINDSEETGNSVYDSNEYNALGSVIKYIDLK